MHESLLKTAHVPPFRRAVLAWYDQSRRDLPWRRTRDPYRVWISEVMLQQTRVAAVLPRYEQFLKRFPSVKKLALAREASVLAEWSGLGYYHRARNLHAAAKVIARAGKFPQTSEAWNALPGVGRYTAAAISSIAFDEPTAVLDGNVARILRRMLARPLTSAASWTRAQQLLDCSRPGDFNQAMMELGATTCLPGEPVCAQCPIQQYCRTRGRDKHPPRKPRQQKRELAYVLATSNGSVHLVKRPLSASLMAGMWELPARDQGVANDEHVLSLKHSITNTDYNVTVVRRSGTTPSGGVWVKTSRVPRLPLTGLAKKILRKAGIIL